MSQLIEKYLNDRSLWTSADHLAYQRSGTKPVRTEWTEARAKALQAAGIEDDASVRIEDMAVSDHFARLRKSP